MWELDCEVSWAPKNWCFWTVVLEKTLESLLDCKEIQPVHPKGNQPWIFIGRTDASWCAAVYGVARSQTSWNAVKWALGCTTTNKASRSDGIPVELFQMLKDDAVKVLHSICQQIWKTQQWPQDWKRSVFFPIPKKGNAKECSNYHTVVHITHASKVMLKILQARLQ